MNYDDAYNEAIEMTISRAKALRELVAHGVNDADQAVFLAEVGDKQTYTGAEVLGWLGY